MNKLLSIFTNNIKQGQLLFKKNITLKNKSIYYQILSILKQEGLIYDFEYLQNTNQILIHLRYYKNFGVVRFLSNFKNFKNYQNISYLDLLQLEKFAPLIILDSSKGIITHFQAKSFKIGGQILFILY